MNNDKKNLYEHYANCFQAFGFSLLGAQQLVTGKAPTNPTDKAMLKAYKDPSKSGAETQDYLITPPFEKTGNVDAKTGGMLSEKADSKKSKKRGFLDWDDDEEDKEPNKPGFWDD